MEPKKKNDVAKKPDTTAAAGFGKRLTALRESAKLTRSEFAAKIDIVGTPLVVLWEGGGWYPPAETLKKIGKVFQCDIHELLLGEPSPSVRVEVEALREVKHSFRGILLGVQNRIEQFKKIDRQVTAVISDIEIFTVKGKKNEEKTEEGK